PHDRTIPPTYHVQQLGHDRSAGQYTNRLLTRNRSYAVKQRAMSRDERHAVTSAGEPFLHLARSDRTSRSVGVSRRHGERPDPFQDFVCPLINATSRRSSADSASTRRAVASRVSRRRRRASAARPSTNGLRKRRNPSTVSLSDAPRLAAAAPYSPACRSATVRSPPSTSR